MGDRPPKDLQGLLRFAMEYTKSEDAPNPATFEEMDPERKEFLENVLKSMTVDVIEQFENALNIMTNKENGVTAKLEAFEKINDYIENIDLANNFVKIGGSNVIIQFLKSGHAELRAASASLIGGLCQNNPFCQKHFLDKNVLPTFIELLSDEQKVACSAMHAISCLVRNFEPALSAFIELGGLECILGCLQSPMERIAIKATFLISTLSSEFSTIRDEFIKLGTVEKLCDSVTPVGDYDVKLETTLSALNALMLSDAKPSASSDFSEKLQKIIEMSSEKPECQEMVEYSQSLKKHFENSEETER